MVRDCLSGEILVACTMLSAREVDLAPMLTEVRGALRVPIAGVVSDGQHSIRNAVASALPGVPHQLCHFHYLREAGHPVFEADRHGKKLLKKWVRPIERAVESKDDPVSDPELLGRAVPLLRGGGPVGDQQRPGAALRRLPPSRASGARAEVRRGEHGRARPGAHRGHHRDRAAASSGCHPRTLLYALDRR